MVYESLQTAIVKDTVANAREGLGVFDTIGREYIFPEELFYSVAIDVSSGGIGKRKGGIGIGILVEYLTRRRAITNRK